MACGGGFGAAVSEPDTHSVTWNEGYGPVHYTSVKCRCGGVGRGETCNSRYSSTHIHTRLFAHRWIILKIKGGGGVAELWLK